MPIRKKSWNLFNEPCTIFQYEISDIIHETFLFFNQDKSLNFFDKKNRFIIDISNWVLIFLKYFYGFSRGQNGRQVRFNVGYPANLQLDECKIACVGLPFQGPFRYQAINPILTHFWRRDRCCPREDPLELTWLLLLCRVIPQSYYQLCFGT